MRARGINYDTGTFPGNSLTRKPFDSQAVRREMAVIAEDLHCDAVRISGREPERLTVAARHAADAGLEVWFSPFPVDLDPVRALATLKAYAPTRGCGFLGTRDCWPCVHKDGSLAKAIAEVEDRIARRGRSDRQAVLGLQLAT